MGTESLNLPKPRREGNDLLRVLHLISTALALAGVLVGLASQVIEHFQKPRAGKDERTGFATAMLGLAVLRMLPGIIRNVKIVAADIRGEPHE